MQNKKQKKKRPVLLQRPQPGLPLQLRNYFRMKVIEPLKFVTETDERPSPTSPTYLRPSCVLKPLFQKSLSLICFEGDAATRRNAESPGMRMVMLPFVDLNS